MSKRDQKLNLIRAEVAKHGHITQAAMRIYVETKNIGPVAFDQASRAGFQQWKASQEK